MKNNNNKMIIVNKSRNLQKDIVSIFFLILSSIFLFVITNDIDINNEWIENLLQNAIAKFLLILGFIVLLIISGISILFLNNHECFIDKDTGTIQLINGSWRFKKGIKIQFIEIKNIVLVLNAEFDRRSLDRKRITYSIHIYDNDLNAYEILEMKNYDKIKEIAIKTGKNIGVDVKDRTHIENYEGFKKRIV